MEVGHYNIAQAQSTSTKAIFFFSQSGVLLFRALNESDNFFSQSGVYCFAPQTKAIFFHPISLRLERKR
jgi:hypothetical protein